MTILYRPVLIESAEQAEALPEQSAVVRWDTPWIATKRGPDENGHTWWESKNGIYDHCEVVRELALVPIEAEEETVERHRLCREAPDVLHRFTTPWTLYAPKETQ